MAGCQEDHSSSKIQEGIRTCAPSTIPDSAMSPTQERLIPFFFREFVHYEEDNTIKSSDEYEEKVLIEYHTKHSDYKLLLIKKLASHKNSNWYRVDSSWNKLLLSILLLLDVQSECK